MPPSPTKTNHKRHRAERRGRRGETVAALYLRSKLYRILENRLKTPLGEIDLVVRRGGTLAFVEVKARTGRTEEEAAHGAVNKARILRAARWYVSRHPEFAGLTIRFDLIFLAGFSWPHHIPNAF